MSGDKPTWQLEQDLAELQARAHALEREHASMTHAHEDIGAALGVRAVMSRPLSCYVNDLTQQLAAMTAECASWHADATSHLAALCEKQAEVNGLEQQLAALQLTWTDERPTVDGLYLFTGECNRELAVVAIRIDVTTHLRYVTGLNARGLYSQGALANYSGQWAGPIELASQGKVPVLPSKGTTD